MSQPAACAGDAGVASESARNRARAFGLLLVVTLSRSKGATSTPKSGHEREVPIAEPLQALLQSAGPKEARELIAKTNGFLTRLGLA